MRHCRTGKRKVGAQRIEEPRARRWLQLWVPHQQRTCLACVTLEGADGAADGRRLTTDEALHAYCNPRFQPGEIDERLQMAVIRVWTPPMVAAWPMPSATMIGRTLRRSKNTSPGPDGLPYGGWKASGHAGWTVLLRLLTHLATTGTPPRSLNDATGAFLPKGTDERDSATTGARTRDAAATRPLSLRNTDAKILAAQVNKPLAVALPAWASARQRGFVRGRGPLEHVTELDGAARRHTLQAFAGGDVLGGKRRSVLEVIPIDLVSADDAREGHHA